MAGVTLHPSPLEARCKSTQDIDFLSNQPPVKTSKRHPPISESHSNGFVDFFYFKHRATRYIWITTLLTISMCSICRASVYLCHRLSSMCSLYILACSCATACDHSWYMININLGTTKAPYEAALTFSTG